MAAFRVTDRSETVLSMRQITLEFFNESSPFPARTRKATQKKGYQGDLANIHTIIRHCAIGLISVINALKSHPETIHLTTLILRPARVPICPPEQRHQCHTATPVLCSAHPSPGSLTPHTR